MFYAIKSTLIAIGFFTAFWLWFRALRASHKAAQLRKEGVTYWEAIRLVAFGEALYTDAAYPWRLRAIRCAVGFVVTLLGLCLLGIIFPE